MCVYVYANTQAFIRIEHADADDAREREGLASQFFASTRNPQGTKKRRRGKARHSLGFERSITSPLAPPYPFKPRTLSLSSFLPCPLPLRNRAKPPSTTPVAVFSGGWWCRFSAPRHAAPRLSVWIYKPRRTIRHNLPQLTHRSTGDLVSDDRRWMDHAFPLSLSLFWLSYPSEGGSWSQN